MVDLTGPVGTGHLMLLAQVLANLIATGPAALVAVTAGQATPAASARLWKLLDAEAPAADHTVVLTAPPGRERETTELAGRLAGWLAHSDATTLLVVDELVADRAGQAELIGLPQTGTGSVTGWRVAPTPKGADPARPWPDADAEIPTGTTELVTGLFPPVDILASRSTLLDSEAMNAADRATARQARDLLTQATHLREYLNQPIQVTGPGARMTVPAVPQRTAADELARLLGQAGL
jgi:hypothetical protein